MSQALYRKYRSRSLDEIVGQDHIASLLSAAIANDDIHHAYLLTGPRGVGKTSIARIIAHTINDLDYTPDATHLDIIEIDAASNNGVDDVRDLRERVHIAPTSARRKVYIIDEVHMLSKPAFNALLKTLEEPPAHAVFILATTDIDKVPATIISRAHRFVFRSIAPTTVAAHLRTIADGEAIDIDEDALKLIAERGGGSFRDSIGLLDQVRPLAAEGKITSERITRALGVASETEIGELLAAVGARDVSAIMKHLDQLTASGVAPHIIAEQLISRLTSSLAHQPDQLPLIERLLKVSSSSLPSSQLLVALATGINDTSATPVYPPVEQAKPAPAPSQPKPTKRPKSTTKPAQKSPETTPKPSAKPDKQTPPEDASTQAADGDYQHKQLLAATDDIALRSLLKKSGSQLVGSTVTIYAGSKFAAKQLDTPAKRQALSATLAGIGYASTDIVISPDKPPLTDSQSAAVAAIMGGGEEVDL